MAMRMDDEGEWTWQQHAACRGLDPDMFFPNEDEPAPVKTVCDTCPVRFSCLSFALERKEKYGIWGGLTGKERAKLDEPVRQAARNRADAEAAIHSAA